MFLYDDNKYSEKEVHYGKKESKAKEKILLPLVLI
jgi:hypothetical protein